LKPRTEDYVPLFPWIGVVLIGTGLGALWQRANWQIPHALVALNDRAPRWLLFLGTWALTVYLVHQPLLLGAMSLVRKLGL
ncbi:MAG TPA: heparan-alpha-glucosaminide N-acetyltransferase domain-containing protein, partial [Burkholderiaceae bacterium]|nr:heparan-alpha-glucosaminide N-acetyltransferase domain-containing protein [Burkholderiaceae bacterium]